MRYFIAAVMMFSIATNTKGEAIAEANEDGTRVVLYDEPCKLDVVSNLKRRATWEEKGGVYEGCWGAWGDLGMVGFYFTGDKTVVIVPVAAFGRRT